jgi:hypothetical protein
MALWLYALTREPLPAEAPAGAAGEPLGAWPIAAPAPAAAREAAGAADAAGALFVVAGEVAEAIRPSEEALRAHDRTVRALAALLDPLLPIRFGERVASAADLAPSLAPRRAAFVAALAEVAGCVQITLRIPSPPEPPSRPPSAPAPPDESSPAAGAPKAEAPGAGTRYLLARRADARAAAAPPPHARPLLDRLAPFVRRQRVATGRPPFAASVYHLVPRDRLDDYLAALAAGAAALDPPIAASGPWPPWSFAPPLLGEAVE